MTVNRDSWIVIREKLKQTTFIVLMTVIVSGCVPPKSKFLESATLVEGKGRVVYVNLEGGFFGIESDDGHRYDITNMPTEFQKHGMRVIFQGRLKEGNMSTHMWGIMLELLYIKRDTTKEIVPVKE